MPINPNMPFATPTAARRFGDVGTPMYSLPRVPRQQQLYRGYGYPQGMRRNYAPRPTFNVKDALVEQTFNAIKHGMELQNLWVGIRQEDEGFNTVRVHIKKKEDIAIAPMVIQKVVSEIGITEFSMHYLKRANTNKKFGLTVYVRCRKNNDDVLKAIQEFTKFKIHARRVRELPSELQQRQAKLPQRKTPSRPSMLILKKDAPKPSPMRKPSRSSTKNKTVVKITPATRNFADEDPDLEEESDEELTPRSRTGHSIVKSARRSKKKSRTISVLVPNRDKEETFELKFENGGRQPIKMWMSSKSKSVSRVDAEKALRPRSATGKVAKSWGSI